MEQFQQFFLAAIFIYSTVGFGFGIGKRKNPFGLCKYYNPLGAFVWIDVVVFGLFFSLVSLLCLIFGQWVLFWVVFSVFWVVRSIGEQIYWFLEQFASKHRNSPHTLWPHKWFKGEETWIVMQIFWQCISVVSIISSVYFFMLWLK